MRALTIPLVAILLPACGGAEAREAPRAFVNDPSATLAFEPASVSASRTPAPCGGASAPIGFQDDFALVATSPRTAGSPETRLRLSIHPGFDRDVPFELAPSGARTDGQSARSADRRSVFLLELARGDSPREIASNAFDRAVVTVKDFPAHDGERLTARFQVRFVDGQTLDVTLSAPLVTYGGPCTAGG